MPQRGGLHSWGLERRRDCKNGESEKETRRVVGKREKEPPPCGGDCGHRGPRGFKRGGTSAERPAALSLFVTGAMSKRLWTLWVSQRRRLIHKSTAEAVSTATSRVI